jgi:hypothetical protein
MMEAGTNAVCISQGPLGFFTCMKTIIGSFQLPEMMAVPFRDTMGSCIAAKAVVSYQDLQCPKRRVFFVSPHELFYPSLDPDEEEFRISCRPSRSFPILTPNSLICVKALCDPIFLIQVKDLAP